MRKRILVVFNPAAGSARKRRFSRVLGHLSRAGACAEVTPTSSPGDAGRIVAGARAADWDAVVIAGGDGTISESLDGLGAESPALGIIPLGTANVAAWEIGLGLDPERIARSIVEGPVRPVHPGRVNGRRFLLMAGIGFDAQVVSDLSLPLKRLLGKGAYGLQAVATLARYRCPGFQVEIDGRLYETASAVVANGHYYAGRYVCAPGARLGEPVLHVCLFERPGFFDTLRYAARLLTGTLRPDAGYRIVEARHVSVEGPSGAPVQVDGDLGTVLPVTIETTGETMKLLYPV